MQDKVEYPSICVDKSRGIFLVAKSKSGVIAPIHVQKHVVKNQMYCCDADCRDIIHLTSSINPCIECCHLQAVCHSHFPPHKPPTKEALEKLFNQKVISQARYDKCLELLNTAECQDCPLVAFANFEELGFIGKMVYYSVYTDERNYCLSWARVTCN